MVPCQTLGKPRLAQPAQSIQVSTVRDAQAWVSTFPTRRPVARFAQWQRQRTWAGCAAAICWLALSTGLTGTQGVTFAQAAVSTIPWHVGDAWQQALARPMDLAWSGQQLRTGLCNLAESQRVAIFLSCRVNPNQLVDFASSQRSLEETLRSLAASRGLGVGFVGPVVYVGRPEVANQLATAVEIGRHQFRTLPSHRRPGLRQRNAMRWNQLAKPRELVQRINDQHGIHVVNLSRLPHDLWPAYDLPGLDYCEQMMLLLAGFDSSFRLDAEGTSCVLIPLPMDPTIKRSYAAGTAALADKLKRLLPTIELTRRANRLVVEGRWEDHRAIQRFLTSDSNDADAAAQTDSSELKRFQLTVNEQRVRALVDHLAATMDLRVHFTPASRPLLDTRVSVALKDVTREQLFQAITQEAGLSAAIKDGTLWIDASQPLK